MAAIKKKGAFGVVYQEVLRNPDITPRAKGIYAYLAGFAGSGDECYPSIELMCKELNMSKSRLYKHMDRLVTNGVVEKTQTYNGNIKGKVIYKITHTVDDTIFRLSGNEETEKQRYSVSENLGSREMRIPRNEETKNNTLKNNSIKNNSIKDNSASDNAPKASRADIDNFFESVWQQYPSKRGKGAVSDTQKKKLYKIGYDELSRAIKRYIAGLSAEEWRKPQNGSTFINRGYVDYLDANYTNNATTSTIQKGNLEEYAKGKEELNRLKREFNCI